MKAKTSRQTDELARKQRVALKALEEAFVDPIRRAYEAGLDAGWILLAHWHASERVEGLVPLSELLASPSAALTPSARSTVVKRALPQKKNRQGAKA